MMTKIIVLLVIEISKLPKKIFCNIKILNCSKGLKIIVYFNDSEMYRQFDNRVYFGKSSSFFSKLEEEFRLFSISAILV